MSNSLPTFAAAMRRLELAELRSDRTNQDDARGNRLRAVWRRDTLKGLLLA